jgi:hypothetical protein
VLHLFGVGFFAKVKMRRDGMFEKMNKKESGKDIDERALAGEVDRFWYHFDKCHRQHVTGAEREEILQVAARPLAIDHEIPAKQVATRGNQAEQCSKRDAKGKFVDHEESELFWFPVFGAENQNLRTPVIRYGGRE